MNAAVDATRARRPSLGEALRDSQPGRWLLQERGPERELVLHHRRIFVLPTRGGLVFIATLCALLVASMNYQLSLGYLMTFLVGAAAWAGLHMTFANLAGLRLVAVRATPVFAGETAAFEVEIGDARGRARFTVRLHDALHEAVLHVGAHETRRAVVQCVAEHRGFQAPPRATISTVFPTGLWRGWSYWRPDLRCLVYPRVERDAPPLPIAESLGADHGTGGLGDDGVASLRPYVPGDAPRLIAWKAYARSGGELLSSKQLEGTSAGELWLHAAQMPASLDLEARLSRLAAWVLAAHARGLHFGVRVDGRAIGPGHGDAHRAACLEALALARTA